MAVVIDPLKVATTPLSIAPYKREDTALLIVDMQNYDANPNYGLVESCRKLGVDVAYYCERLDLITKNIKELAQVCRDKGLQVIYCTIESLTPGGRDRSYEHKAVGNNADPNSKDGAIIDELTPQTGDILLKKTCSGVFNGTNIDQLLRNMDIRNLIVTGVFTNQCVDTAVRDAADRGYAVTLLDDGCAAFHPTLHEAELIILDGIYARISNTADAIKNIRENNA